MSVKMNALLFISLCNFICVLQTLNNSTGDRLYEVIAFNVREREILYKSYLKNKFVYFLNGVTNEACIPMTVFVKKCFTTRFETNLMKHDIQFIITEEYKEENQNAINGFRDWTAINKFVTSAQKNSSKLIEKIVIGKSYEQREIFVVRISKSSSKSAVVIIGGEQGRDWISSAIILEVTQRIINYKSPLRKLLNFYEFYFLPVLNPDGYQYSITMDRLWAKNRKIIFPQTKCRGKLVETGVNIDRNWYMDSLTDDAGCHSVNFGAVPLSEEETKSLAQFLNGIAPKLLGFINVRGFGKMITIPYGNTREYSNNFPLMLEILTSAHRILHDTFNITYDFGNTAALMYNFSGNCADWVKKELNVPLVYTFYMKHGNQIFPLEEQIQPLSDHFTVLLHEILNIAEDMYGPLFSGMTTNFDSRVIIIVWIWQYLTL